MLKNFKVSPVFGLVGLVSLILVLVMIFKSVNTIEPGERGAVNYKMSGGLDTNKVYSEGMVLIAPWNDLIVYNVRQQKTDIEISVLDEKGLTVKIAVTIKYHPIPNKIALIEQRLGKDYKELIVDPTSKSYIRQVTGKYSAEELYSTKREALNIDCEKLIGDELLENNIVLDAVQIRDIDLPTDITNAILAKQKQEQVNLRAELLKQESIYKAAAKKQDAIGDSIQIVTVASAEALAMKLKQEQLKKSPQYVEMLKVQAFENTDGKSWYGENNIFGSETAVVKGLK